MHSSGPEFAPGVLEALAKAHQEEEPGTVATETRERPIVRFLGDRPRRRVIPLEWPLNFDGRDYNALVIRRLSVVQVANYVDQVNEAVRAKSQETIRLPMFEAEDGSDVPAGLIDVLDADDMTRLNEAAADFLPLSFRPKAEGTR